MILWIDLNLKLAGEEAVAQTWARDLANTSREGLVQDICIS